MSKNEKAIIKAIDMLLGNIRSNAIAKEHREAEINPDCPECKFRVLEGYLVWFKDLFEWDTNLPENYKYIKRNHRSK